MPGSTHHQTLSFLMRRFNEVGIRPKPRHGQNFLIDLNLLHLLLDAAALTSDDVVLEVGTGTGSLTVLMAPMAAAVVTVEIDPQLHQLASETLVDANNVRLLHTDALKNKNTLSPQVLDAVRAELAVAPGRRLKLVANLPFNVATPIISNLLLVDTPPHSMTVTIQKELADRILARPSTKDYGALSLWMQSQCQVELVRLLPPTAFWPQPKVTSAILHIARDAQRAAQVGDLRFFHDFCRAMFFHRRKFLRSELLSAFKQQLDKPAVDRLMGELGLGPTARAEELDVAATIRLSDAVHTAVASSPRT